MNPILLAWLIAGVIRVAQGSATVAMLTAAGIMADLVKDDANPPSDAFLALVSCSVASGAIMLSHVNDSGFWIIARYMNLSEKEAPMTWTPLSTMISVVSFLWIMLY